MKIANFEYGGRTRVGVAVGDELIDVTDRFGARADDAASIIAMGGEGHAMVDKCVALGAPRYPLRLVRLLAPLRHPGRILGVGMNYQSFVDEARRVGLTAPPGRVWFSRPSACIVGPNDSISLPRLATDLDYEGELVLIIARRCRNVNAAAARDYIGGYTVANDLTLRESAKRSVVLAKSFETHTPLGPWLVTSDEVGDPRGLAIRTWVNGDLRQESNTSEMVANCFELVAELSSAFTLNPGDIVLTGTPAGCGIFQRPPKALSVGDVVKIEIEKLGSIENRVVEEVYSAECPLPESR